MNTTRRQFVRLAPGAAALASLAAVPSWAQSPPARPSKLIVPYPPGSPPDSLARMLSEELAKLYKQPVVVENRPGASGMIGAKQVSNAAPDGSTLLMHTPAWPAARVFMKTPPVAVPEGLEPVTLVAEGRFALTASAALPARTFDEVIAYARSHPGRLNFATTGGGDSLLYFHALARAKGVKIETITYKGSAEYVTALLANDVQLAFTPEFSMLPYVRDGRLRILAVTGDTPSRVYPEAPTFRQLSLPMIRNNWMAVFAPAGTPADVVHRLNADLISIIRSPEISKRIRDIYFEPVGSSAEQLRRRVDTDIAEWTQLAKAVGLEGQ